MTIQGDKIVSHTQFKCHTIPRVIVGPKMTDIGNTHMHGNYLFGEQDVREKDSILQVNFIKER